MGKQTASTVTTYKFYIYYAGYHMVLCHSADETRLLKIQIDDLDVYDGGALAPYHIPVNLPELFGGVDSEGGVAGTFSILDGGWNQPVDDYLTLQLGTPQPAYRGVVSFISRHCALQYNNPYLKDPTLKVACFHGNWRTDVRGIGFQETYYEIVRYPTNEGACTWDLWSYRNCVLVNYGEPPVSWISSIELADPNTIDSGQGYWLVPVYDENGGQSGYTQKFTPPATPADAGMGDDWRLECDYFAVETPPGSGVYEIQYVCGWHCLLEYTFNEWVENITSSDYVEVQVQRTRMQIAGMNPAHIVYSVLTNPFWGKGLPTSELDLDNFSAVADVLFAEGFGLSLSWAKQTSIEDFLQLVMDHIGGILVRPITTNKYTLKLLRPGEVPSFELLAEHIVRIEEYEEAGWAGATNEYTVKYCDVLDGKDKSVTVHDLASFERQGGIPVTESKEYLGLPTFELAERVAWRDLLFVTVPIRKMTVVTDRVTYAVSPGDVIAVNWPPYDLDGVAFRVVEVDYGTPVSNEITLSLITDPYVTNLPVTQAPPSIVVRPPVPPLKAQPELLYEAPYWHVKLYQESTGFPSEILYPYSFLVALGGNPQSNGSQIKSLFKQNVLADVAGSPAAFCGALKLRFPIHKTSTELFLDPGYRKNLEKFAVGSLAYIGAAELVEVVSFNLATMVMTVHRGILDTLPKAHTAGTLVVSFNANELARSYATWLAGDAAKAWVLTQSTTGTLAQADATELSLTVAGRQGRPIAPGGLSIDGSYLSKRFTGNFSAIWNHRNRLTQMAPTFIHQTDASLIPETGTEYPFTLYSDTGVVLLSGTATEADGEAAPTGETTTFWNGVTLSSTDENTTLGRLSNKLRLVVSATRDGLTSLDSWDHTAYRVSQTEALPLVNADFAAGDLTGWTTLTGAPMARAISELGFTSCGASAYAIGNSVAGLANQWAAYQEIDLLDILSQDYIDDGFALLEITVKYRATEANSYGNLYVEFYDAGMTSLGVDSSGAFSIPTTSLGTKTIQVPVLPGGQHVRLVLSCSSTSANVTGYFGCVSGTAGFYLSSGVPVYYDDMILGLLPIAYWKLDELSGTALQEEISNIDGTYSGTPVFEQASLAPDGTGTSVDFNGASYASVPYNAAINVGSAFTFSACCYLNNLSALYGIFHKGRANVSSNQGLQVLIAATSGVLNLSYFVSPTWYDVNLGVTLPVTTNLRLAIRYNGGTSLDTYINGTKVSHTLPIAIPNSNQELFLGARYGTSIQDRLAGRLDNVAWFDRALTDGEMTTLFEIPAAIGDPYFDQVVALFPFDSDVQDVKGHTFLANNSTWTIDPAGKYGGAFSSTTGSGLYCTSNDFIIGTQDFTFETWAYLNSATDYNFLGTLAGVNTLYMRVSNLGANRYLQFAFNELGSWSNVYSCPLQFDDLLGAWHHIALCRVNGYFRFYVDGARQLLATGSSPSGFSALEPLYAAALGSSTMQVAGNGTDDFSGKLDDYRLTIGVSRYWGDLFDTPDRLPVIFGATPVPEPSPEVPYTFVSTASSSNGSYSAVFAAGTVLLKTTATNVGNYGANLEARFVLPPETLTASISFRRGQYGTWFDDDFSDAQFIVYVVPGADHGEATYDATTWGYNRVLTNRAGFSIKKAVGTLPAGISSFTGSTSYVATTTGPWDGLNSTLKLKLLKEAVTGYMLLEMWEGETLLATMPTNTPFPLDGLIVFHWHNYNNVGSELLSAISATYTVE